jgi:hypothetical protein
MKPSTAKILKTGDLNCKHYEIINGHTGVCKYCGKTTSYPSAEITDQHFTAQNFNIHIKDGRPRFSQGEPI